ncbi:hypothetical protein OG345_41820 (plasmid) [Streptomyces sp. NBC_01220]|uniref:hypothetical protein n=1 Tax=Streptomyces sp. NBC_01220 TaxID=2903781 RepID=UPI00352CE728|nr:hypothetical protein OG345_41820 [Streptomyces sp. NBC_01220]
MAVSTTRTRKAAATAKSTDTEQITTAAEAASAEAPNTETTEGTPGAEVGPKTPDAAPLEPPTIHEAPAPPADPGYVSPTEVIPDDLAEVILDDATKEPPADVDAVFQPLTPYGSTLICTVRLVERTFLGPHRNPVERLLQPKGAHVSESVAARIRERLDAQAAKTVTEQ